ncbi:hypothetical protein SLS64_014307 [Diaporthe eres]
MASILPKETPDMDNVARKKSVAYLGQQHRDIFTRALSNVLSTPAAELAFAEIIDGAPLSQTPNEVRNGILPKDHPVRSQHTELCPGVLEKYRDIRTTLDIQVLQFDFQLLHGYHAASPGSAAFKTRLIEMVAVAIHQIAVYLYRLDLNLGGHQDYFTWEAPKDDIVFYQNYPDGKLPSLFFHKHYRDYDQYPDGVADIVGYWAETRIFGGVVLFDRRKPNQREAHENPDAIFFHSYAENITYRIWRLLDTQKKLLLDFLLSGDDVNGVTNSALNPFPILPDRNNLTRIDPEEPIYKTGIYRDLWERKPLGDRAVDPRMHCCAFNTMGYPSWADFKRSLERALTRRYEIDDRREKEIEAEMEEEELAAMSEQQEEDGGEVARVLKADK